MDYGAKGDGKTDDQEAINRAIRDGSRCGENCNATSARGAIIYFPAGTYRISRPLLQYYFTVFVGDPYFYPTIKGSKDFRGIALIDTNYYIPQRNGAQWQVYVHQRIRHH
jgi:glucan 1,3-beta-glucosidase